MISLQIRFTLTHTWPHTLFQLEHPLSFTIPTLSTTSSLLLALALMEQGQTLEISATECPVPDLDVRFGNPGVTQEASTCHAPTIRCERESCKKRLSQTSARKVMVRVANQTRSEE